MAFRSFLYLNTQKVTEYLSQIQSDLKPASSKKSISASVNLLVAKFRAEAQSTQQKQENDSPAILYDKFANALQGLTNVEYFDCMNSDVDMGTLPPKSIALCEGSIEIPESFDTLATVSKYLPFLEKSGAIKLDGDETSNEFALSVLEQVNADIPIIVDEGDIRVSSKLNTSLFAEGNYQTLEDAEDESFSILFRVISITNKDTVEIFNPVKDFLKLNRTIRRNMKPIEGLEPIITKGPVINAETIAIYH